MLGQLRAVVGRATSVGPFGLTPTLIKHNLTCVQLQQTRNAVSSFNSQNIDQLWKSITVVSKQGQRRGRGKKTNSRLIRDVYKDQVVGDGKVKMIWPGLNHSVLRGKEVVQQQRLETPEKDPNEAVKEAKETRLLRRKVHPLDRGFTSATILGRNLKNTTALQFLEEFDYRVIDNRFVSHMTGMFGRYQRAAIVVVCGNGNGLVGLGYGKSMNKMHAVQKASNKAVHRLLHIERFNNHTVLHDFFTQFYATKIFVERKPEGYGLDCHRIIKIICKMVGIKDIKARVEGSTMPMNIAKAFILGLVRQRNFDEFAEEKKLHVVEFNPKQRNFPKVLASPSVCRTRSEIPTSESLDFKQLSLGGRVKFERPPREPFFTRLVGWNIHLKNVEKRRGAKESMYELTAKYGETRSFLAEKYPEARIMNKVYPKN
ncbi:28S ribosomal protein S5, mitochondrial [Frankliniella fusca]|uniref:Small ribosomal subunit protein uS5m n=1 Tax=Frankliniella fusca TaxID=407009 RepID=A0AAE1I4H5_9NEOP|nr:28S ribosomal protein S5, mitochondrial [Frankliniella fusca]